MPRREYKYLIPLDYLDNLRREMLPFLNHDVYAALIPRKEYTVRSIYLDSSGMLTYHEKLGGTKLRNKFRIRGYNSKSDDSLVFLEIKRKEADWISKDRTPIFHNDIAEFIRTRDLDLIPSANRNSMKIKSSARNFFYYYHLHNLKPVAVITYEREAFECKYGSDLRITFDKNIRTRITNDYMGLFVDENMVQLSKNYFVLEIKYNKLLPRWLPLVLKKYNLIRESVSKYTLSIDAVYNANLFKSIN